jgi:ribosomal protein L21E
MFGREATSPLDTVLPQFPLQQPDTQEHLAKLRKAREIAKLNLEEAQRRMKEKYDKKKNVQKFEVGQLVWLYIPQVQAGQSRELYKGYSGPYILIEQTSPVNFRLAKAHNNQVLKNAVHVNRLKKYISRQLKPPTPEELEEALQDEVTEIDDMIHVDRPKQRQEQEIESEIENRENESETEATETNNNDDETVEYLVEQVLKGRKLRGGKMEYLIRWKGYGPEHDTWEPETHLNDFLKAYIKENPIEIVKNRADVKNNNIKKTLNLNNK